MDATRDDIEYDRLDSLARGYRQSQVLLTAVRLGLFEKLAREERTAEALAAALGADGRGTRILADALTALEVLEKQGGRYRLSAEAREFLLARSPRSRRALLLHEARLSESWARLDDAVRRGEPVPDEAVDPRLRGDAAAFAAAMADIGRQMAERVAAALTLAGGERVLDVGGGPGVYAVAFARSAPGVTVEVLDREETVALARRTAEDAGLAESVTARAGDALEADLGGPFDVVFLSNFVHIYSAERNRELVARCAAALVPGGRLAVKDFLLEPDRTRPVAGALFAVNMLINTETGDAYTAEEVAGWMHAAGLEPGEPVVLTESSSLLLGRKPS